MNCEPAWLPSRPTFVVLPAVSQVPAGERGEKHAAQPLRSRDVGQGLEFLHFPVTWCSQEVGSPARLGTAVARQQGLGPSLWSLQTDSNLASGPYFQSSVSKGESWSQSLRPVVGEGKASQVRPLGSALALRSRGPAISRSQDEGQTAWKWCHCTEAGGHEPGAGAAARTAWTAAPPSAMTAVSPAGAPPPPSAW